MENYEPPVNSVPPVVVILALLIFGIEIAFSAGESGFVGGPQAVGWRIAAFEDYAYSSVIWDYMITRDDYGFDILKRFVTYTFVNATFTSALFAAAFTLAIGKFVGDIFGNIATLIVFLVSTIFGALVFGIVVSDGQPLYGSFTPVYGLIGAYTYVIWVRLGALGASQLRAFRLIGVLMGIQLVFGLLFGSSNIWIAELSGFAAGFLASIIAAPGGWTAFVRRMRRD